MPRYANYDTVALLHRSPGASVWSARSAAEGDGPAAQCLKRVDGTAEDATAAEQFLAGATLQQAMAFQSGGWAPVRALGAAGHGAFCVSDRFPRSAQTVVDGPDRLTSAELRTVLVAVVDALIELQVAYGRPHGNLKPSNVLIGPQVRAGQVCLSDPAADPVQLPSMTRAPDPKAVGRLLFALVTHRPHTAVRWPMRFDEHWRTLGPAGRQWFDLCQSLVHPMGDAAPDLDQLMTRVVAIHPAARRRLRRRARRAVVAGPLLAAVVAAGFVERRPLSQWSATAAKQLDDLAHATGRSKPFPTDLPPRRLKAHPHAAPPLLLRAGPPARG